MKVCIATTPIRPNPTTFPPLGSMAIIQSLRKSNHELKFLHIDYHRYQEEYLVNYFKENNFDMVGISAVVSTAYAYTKYLSNLIKSVNKNTIIFVGGNLAASAEILHKKARVDYCIVGDGELISRRLVDLIQKKNFSKNDLYKIKGITFLDNDKFIFTGYESVIPPDELESPDWNILENENCLDHYIPNNADSFLLFSPKYKSAGRTATIITSKGCVARCTFCHRFEKGYRVKPNEKIIEHIKFLKKKYNVRQLDIGDENFGSYKEQSRKLVEEMNKLGIKWKAAGVRAHTVSLELLKFYKQNGCEVIIYGIESGSKKMLEVMEKKVKLEQNINALKWTYEAGLPTIVQLILAMPGEDDKTIEETIQFLKETLDFYPDNFRRLLSYKISINYAQALPGTPLYEHAREKGFIPKDIDGEEKYLDFISDKDAYSNEHFINYTQQPLLKVLSWRYKINWNLWRAHAKKNLNIEFSFFKTFYAIMIYIINGIFKKNIKSSYLSQLRGINNQGLNSYNSQTSDHYNMDDVNYSNYLIMSLFPWNKITYPLILILVAYKEKQNMFWFFKLLFDHLIWSINPFKKIKLPKESLRKLVKIVDTDGTLELRKGR
jgi:anaerobic magnesium-protoporphyrin IX monomethyl ester cyclase